MNQQKSKIRKKIISPTHPLGQSRMNSEYIANKITNIHASVWVRSTLIHTSHPLFVLQNSHFQKVKLASTDSMTDVPSADDFKEAKEALVHAVEKVEKSLLNAAKKAEQAAEHAIEDEVDILFHERKKAKADETAKKEARGGKNE